MIAKEYIGVYSFRGNEEDLYFIWRAGIEFQVQKVDKTFSPVDMLHTVDKTTFLTKYIHLPHIKRGPQEYERREAKRRIQDTEDEVREQFRKLMVRVRRPSAKVAALEDIKKLAELKEGIAPEHKHMFTDFSTEMRKKKEFKIALHLCARAIELAPNDDHAHFNIARIFIELKLYDKAREHILFALQLDSENIFYKRTLLHIDDLTHFQKQEEEAKKVGKKK